MSDMMQPTFSLFMILALISSTTASPVEQERRESGGTNTYTTNGQYHIQFAQNWPTCANDGTIQHINRDSTPAVNVYVVLEFSESRSPCCKRNWIPLRMIVGVFQLGDMAFQRLLEGQSQQGHC